MLKAQIASNGEKVFYLKTPFSDVRFPVPLDRVEVWVDPPDSSGVSVDSSFWGH